MKALITGITGFTGSHLAEYLLSIGYEVYGTYRWRARMDNLKDCYDKLKLIECDLRDRTAVDRVFQKVVPNYIYHLAAQSYVQSSWDSPSETIINNLMCQLNLFEVLRAKRINPVVLIACSSEEYGMVREADLPIAEGTPLKPLSPYAVSKVAQDLLGYQYYQSYHMKIIRTRAFNHTGPRRGEVFATSSFAKQIALIEVEQVPPVVYVGNLEAKRDFTDVRDVIRAYCLITQKGKEGEVYNVASGKAISIKEVLDILLSFTTAKVEIKVDESRLRPSDLPVLVGSYKKLQNATGWQPTIPIEKSLEDLLNYWRLQVAKPKESSISA